MGISSCCGRRTLFSQRSRALRGCWTAAPQLQSDNKIFPDQKKAWEEREDFQWHEAISSYTAGEGLHFGYVPSGTFVPEETYLAAGVDLSPIYNEIGKTVEGLARPKEDADALHTRQQESWEKYEVFLDSHRLRLRNLLHEGRLNARGQKLPNTISADDAFKVDLSVNVPFESISSKFWASSNIAWGKDSAQGRSATYKLIQVATVDLFREFPFPAPQPARDVAQIGDNYILMRDIKTDAEMMPILGRPPHRWDEFHLEVAKRLQKGLPLKQDAFISEMQDWCKINWGREVARSTLLQKVKPYYDEFIRSKKNEK